MRKTLEVVGLGMLAVLYWITYFALNGTERLPERIPTHFDISGQPNAWGSPGFLWFLPLVAAGLYLLLTLLGCIRYRSYNLPIEVTEANLPFIQGQTILMAAWIKCEMVGLFTYLQWSIIQSARDGTFRLSPLLIPVFLMAIFTTVGWQLTTMIRGAKVRVEPVGSAGQMQNLR
jgi:uncharacterized membrane protein